MALDPHSGRTSAAWITGATQPQVEAFKGALNAVFCPGICHRWPPRMKALRIAPHQSVRQDPEVACDATVVGEPDSAALGLTRPTGYRINRGMHPSGSGWQTTFRLAVPAQDGTGAMPNRFTGASRASAQFAPGKLLEFETLKVALFRSFCDSLNLVAAQATASRPCHTCILYDQSVGPDMVWGWVSHSLQDLWRSGRGSPYHLPTEASPVLRVPSRLPQALFFASAISLESMMALAARSPPPTGNHSRK